MAFVCTKPRPEAGKKVFLKEVANGYWEKHSLVTLTRYINDPRDPVWEAKDDFNNTVFLSESEFTVLLK